MSATSEVKVSIVVACRNEAAHIGGFLESLFHQDLGDMRWEVIIADGMSTDNTRAVLNAYAVRQERLHIIDNPERIVSTGLNAAIRRAQGAVILRMDAHTEYAPDYSRRCVELLETTGAANVGGPARTRPIGLCARAVAAAYHSPFSTGGAHFHDETYTGWVDTVPYGCWYKSTLMDLGLFDEDLVRSQDDELNLRLVRRGGKIWQSHEVVSWYSPRSTFGGLFRQYFQYGFWKVAVIRKHKLPGSVRHLVPVAFVSGHVLLLAGVVAGLVGDSLLLARVCGWSWIAMSSTYSLALLMASITAAKQSGWDTVTHLPLVFAIYHFSYGLGFSAGLLRYRGSRAQAGYVDESTFTRLSR
jgi:glycosyltransferase involved in cell wall biosynthesis